MKAKRYRGWNDKAQHTSNGSLGGENRKKGKG